MVKETHKMEEDNKNEKKKKKTNKATSQGHSIGLKQVG